MRSGNHYKKVITPDGRKMDEHRYKMEVKIGRRLTRYEVVHHIDEDINNNDISNLDLMPLGKHTTLHLLGKSNNKKGKISATQVIEIREKYLQGYVLKELSKEYNIHFSSISLIVNLKLYPYLNKDGINERLAANRKPKQICKYKKAS